MANQNRLEVRHRLSTPGNLALSAPPRPGQWFVSGDLDWFLRPVFQRLSRPAAHRRPGAALRISRGKMVAQPNPCPSVGIAIFGRKSFLRHGKPYCWKKTQRTGRADVTAIPFGVNTPTIFAYVFLTWRSGLSKNLRLPNLPGTPAKFFNACFVVASGANRRRVLHRLVAAPRATGCSSVPSGRSCDCLSVPGIRIADLSDSGARIATGGDYSCHLRLADSPAFPLARRRALHRSRRRSGCAAEGLSRLFASPGSAAGASGFSFASAGQSF